VKRDELAAARRADVTLVVSAVEQAVLAKEAPGLRVELLSLIEEGIPATTPFAKRSGVLFVANFAHPPNVDALEYYVREVHPRVTARVSDASLTVVGAEPPLWLAPSPANGVRFTGYVADICPYFASARLSVAPLRYGAGVKGKVVTSLRLGTPAVVTSVAAEGIDLVHGRDVLVADAPAAFADAVVALHTDAELWSALAESGYRRVAAQFSSERAEEALRRILGE
jgi:glycosyltransferase involved in cell wall biosynthesis